MGIKKLTQILVKMIHSIYNMTLGTFPSQYFNILIHENSINDTIVQTYIGRKSGIKTVS
jgi:hypothetical protein